MTKTIYYTPKITEARTQYRNILEPDRDYVLQYLIRTLTTMATLGNCVDEDLRMLRDQWWRRRRNTLPRGRTGQNTPESMVGGIVHNLLYAEPRQNDLTDRQCDAIEEISNWMNAIDTNNFENIRFQIRVV